MKTDRNPNASLPWVIVFASAAMTLSSSTVRTRAAALPPRAAPVRLEEAASEPECECGDSCACPREDAPAPAAPVRRDPGLRA